MMPEPPQNQKFIWITFQKEGIHRFPAAMTDMNLFSNDEFDVSFLAYPHRHMFHFRVELEVFHDDRDVEFIQLKRKLQKLYDTGTIELNNKSCEMIADDVYGWIKENYPGRDCVIEVSEDGENGCRNVYYSENTK